MENNNNTLSSIKDFFIKNKNSIIPVLGIIILGSILLFIIALQNNATSKIISTKENVRKNNEQYIADVTPKKIYPTTASAEEFPMEPLEKEKGFIKKVKGPGDSTIFSMKSSNDARPNIFVMIGTSNIQFERRVINPNNPEKITDYINSYGQPEKILNESFYGKDTNLYIYATQGIAIIVNTQTGQVLEQQTFYPMSTDEYLQKFSDSGSYFSQ